MKNAQFSSKDVRHACLKKLQMDRNCTSEDHCFIKFENAPAARITFPKGSKNLPPKTYKNMARQLRLSVEQFDEFLTCTFGYKDYVEEMEIQGVRIVRT